MSTAKFPEQYLEKVTLDGNDFILVSDSADADELKKAKKTTLESQLNINYSNINRGLILVNPTRDEVSSAGANNTWYEYFRFNVNCEDPNMVLDLRGAFAIGLGSGFTGTIQRFRFGLQRSDTPFAGSPSTGSVLNLASGSPDSSFDAGVQNRFTLVPGSGTFSLNQVSTEFVDADTGTAGLKYYRVVANVELTPVTNLRLIPFTSNIKIYKSKG